MAKSRKALEVIKAFKEHQKDFADEFPTIEEFLDWYSETVGWGTETTKKVGKELSSPLIEPAPKLELTKNDEAANHILKILRKESERANLGIYKDPEKLKGAQRLIEAHSNLKPSLDAWDQGIDSADLPRYLRNAVEEYAGSGYNLINSMNRKGIQSHYNLSEKSALEESDQLTRSLDRLLADYNLLSPMTLYRGVKNRSGRSLAGVPEHGFQSWTVNPHIANEFAGADPRTKGAVLFMDVPAGIRGFPMRGLGTSNEREVLLPREHELEQIADAIEDDFRTYVPVRLKSEWAKGGNVDTGIEKLAELSDKYGGRPGESEKTKENRRRYLSALGAQLYGEDEKGNLSFLGARPGVGVNIHPGVLDEVISLPEILYPLAQKTWESQMAMNIPAHLSPKLRAAARRVGALFDETPEFSKNAEARLERISDALNERLRVDRPQGLEENMIEALGTMTGQVPIPSSMAKKIESLAKKVGLSPVEWFSPTVVPSAKNYAIGTTFGGTMNTGLQKIADLLALKEKEEEQQPDDERTAMSKAKGGKVSLLDQAVELLRRYSDTRKVPENKVAEIDRLVNAHAQENSLDIADVWDQFTKLVQGGVSPITKPVRSPSKREAKLLQQLKDMELDPHEFGLIDENGRLDIEEAEGIIEDAIGGERETAEIMEQMGIGDDMSPEEVSKAIREKVGTPNPETVPNRDEVLEYIRSQFKDLADAPDLAGWNFLGDLRERGDLSEDEYGKLVTEYDDYLKEWNAARKPTKH